MRGIGSRYKAQKDNVIDLFNAYIEKRGDINDGVDIEFLESRINSLKDGKYILAVAGEVKAGKSTFINALLGSEILPSDVLQATSAIVEIFKSDKSFLKVKYASGETEEIYDDINTPQIEEATEKLKVLCSIQDEYRNIIHVTGILNKYILESPTKLIVTEDLISRLEKESKEDDLEEDPKPLSKFKEELSNYINNHNRENIPSEILFGYPLKWDFDELRIVDTPGVNALGRVQDISFKFFENANAVIFVKKIDPIESKAFKIFVNSVITNRSRQTLFLALTHLSNNMPSADRLLNEAKRLYENNIPPERIIAVDSLSKIIHSDLENGKDYKTIKEESELKAVVINNFKCRAEDKGIKFSDEIFLEWSGFEKMYEVIDQFTMFAPNLQLSEILDSIRKGYSNQNNQYVEKVTRLEDKKRNPQVFEHAIDKINNALKNYKLTINETTEEIKKQFSGRKSDLNSKIDELKIKYPELITKSKTVENVRKYFFDASNEINSVISEYSKSISDRLNEKIVEKENHFKNKYNITLPKVDLKSIEVKATAKAYTLKPIYKTRTEGILENWNWLKFNWTEKSRTKTIYVNDEKVYDEIKFIGDLKTLLKEEFSKILKSILIESKEVLDNYLNDYKTKILKQMEERQKALEEEKNKQQSNQEIIMEVDEINKKKELIIPEIKKIEEIMEDLS